MYSYFFLKLFPDFEEPKLGPFRLKDVAVSRCDDDDLFACVFLSPPTPQIIDTRFPIISFCVNSFYTSTPLRGLLSSILCYFLRSFAKSIVKYLVLFVKLFHASTWSIIIYHFNFFFSGRIFLFTVRFYNLSSVCTQEAHILFFLSFKASSRTLVA
ncbi:hypothetical protein HanPI659440_Chr16g0647391 [Helianthus annuus]|nr:hypothetical protein HanPI659440_Chr16g0647391 [Helianthus annuus]